MSVAVFVASIVPKPGLVTSPVTCPFVLSIKVGSPGLTEIVFTGVFVVNFAKFLVGVVVVGVVVLGSVVLVPVFTSSDVVVFTEDS